MLCPSLSRISSESRPSLFHILSEFVSEFAPKKTDKLGRDSEVFVLNSDATRKFSKTNKHKLGRDSEVFGNKLGRDSEVFGGDSEVFHLFHFVILS